MLRRFIALTIACYERCHVRRAACGRPRSINPPKCTLKWPGRLEAENGILMPGPLNDIDKAKWHAAFTQSYHRQRLARVLLMELAPRAACMRTPPGEQLEGDNRQRIYVSAWCHC